jgi:hypothetical protein
MAIGPYGVRLARVDPQLTFVSQLGPACCSSSQASGSCSPGLRDQRSGWPSMSPRVRCRRGQSIVVAAGMLTVFVLPMLAVIVHHDPRAEVGPR